MHLLPEHRLHEWSNELPVARTPLVDGTEGLLVFLAGLLVILLTLVVIFVP